MLKKIIYILLLIIVMIIFILNFTSYPYIESEVGSKKDLEYNISLLEKNENLKFLLTESDLTNNEYTYLIYDYDTFDINNINNYYLSKFNIKYDDNERIENIDYVFSLNNKSSLEILHMLTTTTLFDLTDHGYEVVSKYLKYPTINNKHCNKERKYITSNKTLIMRCNKDNSYTFIVR